MSASGFLPQHPSVMDYKLWDEISSLVSRLLLVVVFIIVTESTLRQCVCCLHICKCTKCVQYLWGPEEGARLPGTKVTDGFESSQGAGN